MVDVCFKTVSYGVGTGLAIDQPGDPSNEASEKLMDIVTSNSESKRRFGTKHWLIGGGAAAILGAVVMAATSIGGATYIVDGDNLLYGSVARGDFAVQVRGAGVLAPKRLYWQSAEVDGTVSQVFVKAGSYVEVGDPLIKLSNPKLVKEVDATRWELEALMAEHHAEEVALESELLAFEEEVLNTRLDQQTEKLKLDAQDTLIERGFSATSGIDYETAKLAYAQFDERIAIQGARLQKKRDNLEALRQANEARVNKMRNTLAEAQGEADALLVRATVPGVLQEMALALGQSVTVGSNVAKLASRDELIAVLEIQEVQVRDVALEQAVTVDTRGSQVRGIVTRIDPVVQNGLVSVDVELLGQLPAEARADLSVNGTIQIAESNDTVFVQRPVFARSFSDTTLFKVSADGRYAERVAVALGQGSTQYIEIISGLAPGDRVVVSDPSDWEDHQRIQIN